MAGPNSSYKLQVACQKKGILEFGANGPSFASFGQANNGRPDPSLIGARPGLSSTEWSKPRSPCCGSDPTVAVPCRSYTWPVPLGATFPGVCGVGGCCGLVVFVGGLEVSW